MLRRRRHVAIENKRRVTRLLRRRGLGRIHKGKRQNRRKSRDPHSPHPSGTSIAPSGAQQETKMDKQPPRKTTSKKTGSSKQACPDDFQPKPDLDGKNDSGPD